MGSSGHSGHDQPASKPKRSLLRRMVAGEIPIHAVPSPDRDQRERSPLRRMVTGETPIHGAPNSDDDRPPGDS